MPELEGQAFPKLARHVLKTGEAYHEREAKAFLKRTNESELEERYFDQSYTRMLDQTGRPYGVFIHAVEVTDRVFARRRLEESEERLRVAIESADLGTWEP